MPARRAPDLAAVRDAVGGVVAGLDGTGPPPARATLATAVRGSLRRLEEQAPGHTVEVRVPPFGAVQCVAGPRHTRGTPPNVVETDATTWIALLSSRATWEEAIADGRLRASGHRCDEVARWLPVVAVPIV